MIAENLIKSIFSNINLNNNAFQYDAYRPLQWPSRGGVQGRVCPGGVCLVGVCPGGVCVSKGLCVSRGCVYLGRMYTSPMDRMTDACENITFPQLLLRTVITFLQINRTRPFCVLVLGVLRNKNTII